MAHQGEWILNDSQQARIAKRIGKPIGWVKDFLFGPRYRKGDRITDHPTPGMDRQHRAAMLLKSMGPHYFGPQVNDWAAAVPQIDGYQSLGYEQHPNDTRYEPAFIDTPLHQYVEVNQKNLGLIKQGKGFWLPEYVKRSMGFIHASRKQVMDWKRANVMASGVITKGMTAHMQPGALNNVINSILRSPLWSYGTGGVVGFQPASPSYSTPAFASGGITTVPALQAADKAAAGVTQHFQIQTTSPAVDVDYVMRIAKIHAESAY
jgi:hypothetical protein